MQHINTGLPLKDLSNCIRSLVADAVEHAASGHPGMPLGFADVFTTLVCEFLKFYPQSPRHHLRDRVILSAGHGSMLLYAFYYLAGYKDFTLQDIMNFRNLHSKAPGHPEYGVYPAIETTTGPLGQGFATAVGMAIAAAKMQQGHKIYAICGDGCLMEGVAYEAASIAGHMRLKNLILLFDDNGITIDGSTSLTISEKQLGKFESLGWEVEAVDGHDFDQIRNALDRAQKATRPYFIAFKTTIAMGARSKAGSEKAHGSPLGLDEVNALKDSIGFKQEKFFIPNELLALWRSVGSRSDENNVIQSSNICDLRQIFRGIKAPCDQINEATRVSSGKILHYLTSKIDKMISGSADLSLSNNVKGNSDIAITKESYNGHFIHYGTRENAMGAIANGLALEGFIPICGTFLVFSDYMRPSIRLAAIMNLKVIYVMTHDSIGVGEDGPTHQPIEHLASIRAMPNITLMRPADFTETLEAWEIALTIDGPVMLSLTRQAVPNIRTMMIENDNQSMRGAYIISDHISPDITIFASGSELQIAIDVKNKLLDFCSIRVVSLPSFELFFSQPKDYIESLLGGAELKIGIEAGSSFGWERVIGRNGVFFGIDQFGESGKAEDLYVAYHLEANYIANKIRKIFNNSSSNAKYN